MWSGDISNGVTDGEDSERPELPGEKADQEHRLYKAIRDAGESAAEKGDAFLAATNELALHVARHLLRSHAGLLDPMMFDPGASENEAAHVIQGLWFEILFGPSPAWCRIESPDAGGRPSAYLWKIAKRHMLLRGAQPPASLDAVATEQGEEGQTLMDKVPAPRPVPHLNEWRAWEYVRRTDSLSQAAVSIAEEILTPESYGVWHERTWGNMDSSDPMTFAEVGDRLGISEEAARKRYYRAQSQFNDYVGSHPDDERVTVLSKLRYVDGLRVWYEDD